VSIAHYSYLIFILAVFTQLLFLLVYFNFFAKHKSNSIRPEYSALLPVSVLIVARNEKANLSKLLPELLNQSYPAFDVAVMDDSSTDGTSEWMHDLILKYPQIKYYQRNENPRGKKFALAEALPLISNDLILLTDADCRPGSSHWIRLMVQAMEQESGAVLGYSPYIEVPGWLSEVIRLETAYTATLYFSFALHRHPYMGVGRNLIYRKQALIQYFQPFRFEALPSGDDDLTINAMGVNQRIGIQYDRDSWMYSIPKSSWKEWMNQKKRHVRTAIFYKSADQIRLMFYYGSLTTSWVFAIGLGFYDYRIWLLWVLVKGLSFFPIVKPCLIKLGVSLRFWNWIRAELIYVFGLIYLFPFSTFKKWDKW